MPCLVFFSMAYLDSRNLLKSKYLFIKILWMKLSRVTRSLKRPWSEILLVFDLISKYSARRLIGSRLTESAAYCKQKMIAHLYPNSTQNTSVNWIIRLLLSLFWCPKVILSSGEHCTSKSLCFLKYVSERRKFQATYNETIVELYLKNL